MAWVIVAILVAVIFLLISLYRRALSEASGTISLLVMVLLRDDVYKSQKDGLIGFVNQTPANNAGELSMKVLTAMSGLAAQVSKSSIMLGAPGFLWKLKQDNNS